MDLGIPSVSKMLSMMTHQELKQWEGYYLFDSGGYEKLKKRRDAPKLLKESLKHLVKKKNG